MREPVHVASDPLVVRAEHEAASAGPPRTVFRYAPREMWSPDDARLEAARAALVRHVAAIDDDDRETRVERVHGLLVAAGTIALSDAARSVTGIDERARAAVRRDLDRLDAAELDEATRVLGTLGDRDAAAGSRDPSSAERVHAALTARTELEIARHGAVVVFREPFAWKGPAAARIRAFDDVAEEHLFELVAFNAYRRAQVAWIAPRFRGDFWWLSRAVELPPDTIDRMADVAALVARFAPARAAFDDRVREAERREAARSRGSTKRIARSPSLQTWLDAREPAQLMTLATDPAYELTFRAPDTFLVRARSPLRLGERPTLRVGVVRTEMEPVAGARMKYETKLDLRARMSSPLIVVLPFPDGDRAVDVLERLRA